MASIKFFLLAILVVGMMAAPVFGKTVTIGVKNRKVSFSGFSGDRKYSVKTKINDSKPSSFFPCSARGRQNWYLFLHNFLPLISHITAVNNFLNTYANVSICTGDTLKFKWNEEQALAKYEEMGQFSNPKTAAALADCPQLWNSAVSEDLLAYHGTFKFKETSPVTKYFASSHRYRGGRWECDSKFASYSVYIPYF